MNNKLFVDLHVLHSVPPSCINRDDLGRPKTAVYGGVTRARVSSQAWKHAIRSAFKEIFTDENLGFRTKHATELIAKYLEPSDDALKIAEDALAKAGVKSKDVLFFISTKQAQALAELAKNGEKNTAAYKDAIHNLPSIDIALFGRMVAEDQTLNVDAACQVAHAISTHAVQTEYDYFSALDDLAPEENSGASHLGTLEYNSATLYRYATINVPDLYKSIGDDTAPAVQGFVKAFIDSMPTGKQNSYANKTLPDFVYIALRKDQPINLVGAFEKPVASQNGYIEASKKAFLEYAEKIYDAYCAEPYKTIILSENTNIDELLHEVYSNLKGEN